MAVVLLTDRTHWIIRDFKDIQQKQDLVYVKPGLRVTTDNLMYTIM